MRLVATPDLRAASAAARRRRLSVSDVDIPADSLRVESELPERTGLTLQRYGVLAKQIPKFSQIALIANWLNFSQGMLLNACGVAAACRAGAIRTAATKPRNSRFNIVISSRAVISDQRRL